MLPVSFQGTLLFDCESANSIGKIQFSIGLFVDVVGGITTTRCSSLAKQIFAATASIVVL